MRILHYWCAFCMAQQPVSMLSPEQQREILVSLQWRDGKPEPEDTVHSLVLCRRCQVREWLAHQGPVKMMQECSRRKLFSVRWSLSVVAIAPGGERLVTAEHSLLSSAMDPVRQVDALRQTVAERIVEAMSEDGTFEGISYPGGRRGDDPPPPPPPGGAGPGEFDETMQWR